MERVEYKAEWDRFPLSMEALEMMERRLRLLEEALSRLSISSGESYSQSGSVYVMSGCVYTSASEMWSPGIVACEGELFDFEGGVQTSNVGVFAVVDEARDVNADGTLFEGAYHRRRLRPWTGSEPSGTKQVVIKEAGHAATNSVIGLSEGLYFAKRDITSLENNVESLDTNLDYAVNRIQALESLGDTVTEHTNDIDNLEQTMDEVVQMVVAHDNRRVLSSVVFPENPVDGPRDLGLVSFSETLNNTDYVVLVSVEGLGSTGVYYTVTKDTYRFKVVLGGSSAGNSVRVSAVAIH